MISSLSSCVPGTGAPLSKLWMHMCCPQEDFQEIQGSLPFLCELLLQSLANSTLLWFLSILLKKTSILPVFPYQWLAKLEISNVPSLSVFHQERASCTGDLHTREQTTCHVELISCCCRAVNWLCPNYQYYHSRTQYYNNLFLKCWNSC